MVHVDIEAVLAHRFEERRFGKKFGKTDRLGDEHDQQEKGKEDPGVDVVDQTQRLEAEPDENVVGEYFVVKPIAAVVFDD